MALQALQAQGARAARLTVNSLSACLLADLLALADSNTQRACVNTDQNMALKH
jgi:hypothetical protein